MIWQELFFCTSSLLSFLGDYYRSRQSASWSSGFQHAVDDSIFTMTSVCRNFDTNNSQSSFCLLICLAFDLLLCLLRQRFQELKGAFFQQVQVFCVYLLSVLFFLRDYGDVFARRVRYARSFVIIQEFFKGLAVAQVQGFPMAMIVRKCTKENFN